MEQADFPAGRGLWLDEPDAALVILDWGKYRRGFVPNGETLISLVSCRSQWGSASELEYHMLLAYDLELLQKTDYQRLFAETVEVKRMLASLLHNLRADG